MAEKEASTDILVSRMLEECGIAYDPQGSNVKLVERENGGFPKLPRRFRRLKKVNQAE
ncbi:MAG: hypothetical protein II014_00260 [Bifidobacteriaceae bacterium]|nr:hypothetical protein [Bifidobacteriaceae bacterium]